MKLLGFSQWVEENLEYYPEVKKQKKEELKVKPTLKPKKVRAYSLSESGTPVRSTRRTIDLEDFELILDDFTLT